MEAAKSPNPRNPVTFFDNPLKSIQSNLFGQLQGKGQNNYDWVNNRSGTCCFLTRRAIFKPKFNLFCIQSKAQAKYNYRREYLPGRYTDLI